MSCSTILGLIPFETGSMNLGLDWRQTSLSNRPASTPPPHPPFITQGLQPCMAAPALYMSVGYLNSQDWAIASFLSVLLNSRQLALIKRRLFPICLPDESKHSRRKSKLLRLLGTSLRCHLDYSIG